MNKTAHLFRRMGLHLKIPAGLWLVAVLALAACVPAAAPQAEEPALTPAASSTAASTPTMEAPLESPPSGALLEQAVQALRDAAS
ncbi:MAG: hypothetical protein AAGU05_16470, partial [Anaerolineaceae bacterium]